MATYSEMQTRIADELARTDLTEQIKKAILSAVEFYKDDRFWFNEGEVSLTTADGTESQAMDVTFGEIDEKTITISGNRYPLKLVSYSELRRSVLLTTSKGQPGRIAIFDEKVWYDPVSDGIYTVKLSGLVYFTTLSVGSDTNAWTTEAEQLIRHHAKADLFANIIRNDKEAQKMIGLSDALLSKLKQKTVQKIGSGRLKATSF